jgi:hypothetical protein
VTRGSVAAGAGRQCAPAALVGHQHAALNFTVRCHVLELSRFRWFKLFLFGLTLATAGCEVLGFDHSARIAKALLYHDDKLDDVATTAALNARFPAGSNLGDLQLFVSSLGGRCSRAQDGHPICEIPVRGGFCVVTVISLSVILSSEDKIQHVEAHAGTAAC